MSAHQGHEVDAVTGVSTTGHSWDGIRELNNPLPRWWLWVFYATIVWAFAYWVVYPAWPLITTHTNGMFGWNSRTAVQQDLSSLQAQRAAMTAKLTATPLDQIEANPELLNFARAMGRAAFGDNCAPCHGAGAQDSAGFPNLNDDAWLWGGSLANISQTIHHGIRWTADDQTRQGNMPAFGRDGMLDRQQIAQVANYVRSLTGQPTQAGVDLAAGAKVFADNCAVCHGPEAKGNPEVGAPNLTSGIWLYGGDLPTIEKTVFNGRGGVMPAWGTRLSPTTIKALTVYVHTLGGGQ